MAEFKENYVVDDEGNHIGVLLDINEYNKLLEELEELDALRAYDAAEGSSEEAIPFEEAIADIEHGQIRA